MTINWGALALVAVATVVAAVSIVGLFSLGVAAVTTHRRSRGGAEASSKTLVAGYACISAAGLIAVYGLYLIIPQFH
jgi:hypothetical protein